MFGRFELLDRIGLGGMAEVWRARVGGVGGFEKIVVIKKILPSNAQNRTFIDMLLAEARLCAVLQHANIVQTYENGEIDGIFYIAMEYVPGHDLFKILSRATQTQVRIPPELCLYIAAEVAKGLHYAHHAKDIQGRPLNIIHRDVSPSNVLISEAGEVKVMDFGVAKASTSTENATRSGVLKGKLGYMSPEQVTGRPFDHRSDIFSLGIILYESLTLKRLFLAKTDLETLVNIRDARIEHKFKKHAYIEEDVRDVLRKALAREADDRYPTALAMHDDILQVLFNRRQHAASGHLARYVDQLFAAPLPQAAGPAGAAGEAAAEAPPPIPADDGPTSKNRDVAAGQPATPPAAADPAAGLRASGPRPATPSAYALGDGAKPATPAGYAVAGTARPATPPAYAPAGGAPASPAGRGGLDPASLESQGVELASDSEPDGDAGRPHTDVVDLDDVGSGLYSPGQDAVSVADFEHGEPAPLTAPPKDAPPGQWRLRLADGSEMGGLSAHDLSGMLHARTATAADQVSLGSGPFAPLHSYPQLQEILPKAEPAPQVARLSGPLSQWIFVRLLYKSFSDRASGCLELRRGDAIKSLYFRRGRVQFIASNQHHELLGPFMIAQGYINQPQLDAATAQVRVAGGKLGDVLIGMGALKPFQLFEALERQMRAKFMDAFGWDSGSYAFFDQMAPPQDLALLDLDPVPLLAEGVRDRVSLAVLEPVFADKLDRRLYQVKKPLISVSDLKFQARESKALALLLAHETPRQAYNDSLSNRQQRLALLHVMFLMLQTELLTFDPERA